MDGQGTYVRTDNPSIDSAAVEAMVEQLINKAITDYEAACLNNSQKLPISSPRVLVVVEKGGEIGIVEEYMGGDGDLSYWTNSVMEVVIGEEAKLGHSYIQTQSLSSAPIKWTSIQQIIADDAKCSHGAAICDLKEDQLCYLQARGIDLKTARKALIVSFGAEVIDQFPSNDLRKKGKLHVKKLLDPEVHVENYV
ncbi:hypothetical protein E3N88_16822 [Mikania micrantha]|uniref:SUF system FeS cluster assembly SufBD core domain-containing protein n=1 Tax=Mikania micrantha TaxID=192012 RepID=A0A5N6NQ41_9ASTR|nr:hypothetical protein E3N88_16822 [Mikania micrantha]